MPSLANILRERIYARKSTFCCFVDFAAAFDSLNRDLLLYALCKVGVQGSFIRTIAAMYETTECAVRVNDKITDSFPTEAGIRQGQNDSPTLFAVFINSLAQKIKDMNVGVSVDETKVSILLYADDIVLIGETESELQAMLDELVVWCKTWCMKVNIENTQTVHLRSKQTSSK